MKPIEMERLGTMDDPIPIYSLVSSGFPVDGRYRKMRGGSLRTTWADCD